MNFRIHSSVPALAYANISRRKVAEALNRTQFLAGAIRVTLIAMFRRLTKPKANG